MQVYVVLYVKKHVCPIYVLSTYTFGLLEN